MEENNLKKITLTIRFTHNLHTILASEVLGVDKELKGSGIQRKISVQENDLLVTFIGADYKKLRVTINAFLKNVLLIVKTFNSFSLKN